MKTGIIVAMCGELEALRKSGLENVRLSGIGKAAAARAATEMILTERPDCIINSGCAGSMCAGVEVGDFVVADACAYHDVWCGEPNEPGCVQGEPRFFKADSRLLAKALQIKPENSSVHCGLICSGDQFFVSLEEDERIRGLYPEVLACDMESAAMAQVCRHYSIPFLSVRIISDMHTSKEGQRLSYESFWKEISMRSFEFVRRLADSL